MRFKSDRQRRCVMAKLYNSSNSDAFRKEQNRIWKSMSRREQEREAWKFAKDVLDGRIRVIPTQKIVIRPISKKEEEEKNKLFDFNEPVDINPDKLKTKLTKEEYRDLRFNYLYKITRKDIIDELYEFNLQDIALKLLKRFKRYKNAQTLYDADKLTIAKVSYIINRAREDK